MHVYSRLPRRAFLQRCSTAAVGLAAGVVRLRAAEQGAFERIDAHAHYCADTPDALAVLAELNLKVLNVCVGRSRGGRGIGADIFRGVAKRHPHYFAWCTSIDAPDFENPKDYVEKTIAQLDADFRDGAIGCKVWKNFGLVIKKPDGGFFMVDDPLLEPVFRHIDKAGRTLLMHIAEPLAAWLALDPTSSYYSYYKNHPEYHFHGQKDIPSHAELMHARDRVVERHPRLRIVGAHLASLETDVAAIAERFKRYPNFCVDSSGIGRAVSLSEQEPAKVRAFFAAFPDRVVFGTDLVPGDQLSAMATGRREAFLFQLKEQVLAADAFYRSSGDVTLRGKRVQGLALPPAALRQFFSTNAKRIYAGI